MVSRLGLVISGLFRRTCPDPFVLAIALTLVAAALALAFGRYPPEDSGLLDRAEFLLDAWRADDGLWKFLAFGMQMCLILVTGHALASTRPVRAMINALAAIPRTTASAAALIGLVACLAALLNWGLGLIVGALLARDVGRSMHRRGIRAHYPLLCAAGYMGLLVWHGGLSGSAPLSMTTMEGAAKVLKNEPLQMLRDYNTGLGLPPDTGVPLSQTIGSGLNIVVTCGLLVGIPMILAMLAPKREEDLQTIGGFEPTRSPELGRRDETTTLTDRIDRSPILAGLLALPMLVALVRSVQVSGVGRLDLNTVNLTMIALGLILHGSPRAYMDAVTDGARGCAGIIIQFPLYAGIMAMMSASQLVQIIAEGFAAVGNERTIPLMSYSSAAVVNLFVPSGGGQWGIQGPIALATGIEASVSPGRMIMSVAYGDQLTNMLQPFWALPLLAITGVRARDIVGYTAIVMLFAAAWIALGLLVF